MIGRVYMKKTFEVPIFYKGFINYIIEAESRDEAQSIACAKFNNNDEGDIPVIECEEIDRIGEIEEIFKCPHCHSTKVHGLVDIRQLEIFAKIVGKMLTT